MNVCRRLVVVIALLLVGATHASPVLNAAQQPAQPQQQDEFVPVDQLPPQDQLPAAPLLIAAYVFVLVALFVYVMSVARRLSTVQREIERLESDVKKSGRT